ncbi:MAG: MCE family protein [Ignavibacteria bacterium]|nr:MCE family protein [Ignavibacteria bacterium]
MKNDTKNKVRLGMFILAGVAVLIIAVYFIGDKQQIFTSTFKLKTIFRDVGGLQVGSNVRFSGINVGTVEEITITSDTSVRVSLLVEDGVRKFIKKNALASINSDGLMGSKILTINPGSGLARMVEDGDVIAASKPIDIDAVMMSLKGTIDDAANITNDLSRITGSIAAGKGTIGKLLMDPDLSNDFGAIVLNLHQGSESFLELTNRAKSLQTSIDNINLFTGDLARITKKMENGEGAVGRLFMDTTFALQLDSIVFNLNEGSKGLRELTYSTNKSLHNNIDSIFINIKDATRGFKDLMEKAQSSWLLWGF